MLEQLFRDESALARHRAGPFAQERERYLQHCAEHGATRTALRLKANELLWICQPSSRRPISGHRYFGASGGGSGTAICL